ncbi:hypothetical protein VNO80_17001 [Phaseolus coccineus]|uniref:Uncharacterized protein n=1 Tax=Phaseolus coccineus TaxID=3886 RepID=A0AAN9MNI5_PHACN
MGMQCYKKKNVTKVEVGMRVRESERNKQEIPSFFTTLIVKNLSSRFNIFEKKAVSEFSAFVRNSKPSNGACN